MAENRIALLRRANGLNQKELGVQLGVAQTTVSAWERGINEPDSESMNKMAKMFETTIGYLAGFEEEPLHIQHERQKRFREQAEQRQEERAIRKHLHEEELAKHGLTEDDLADIEIAHIYDEWENGTMLQTFEAYCAGCYIDQMEKTEREMVLRMVKAAAQK